MAIAISLALYLLAGLASVVWLGARGRLPRGPVSLGMAALFWPAFLAVCLAPRPGEVELAAPTEPIFVDCDRRLAALPIDDVRRVSHRRALVRLEQAVGRKRAELRRLHDGDARLAALLDAAPEADRSFVREERDRLAALARQITDEIARAEAQVAALSVRLEVFAIRAARDPAELEPFLLGAELERLVEAQEEVERLADPAPAPASPGAHA